MKIRENLNTLHKSSWMLVDEQTVPPILALQQHLHLHFGEERWRHTDQALGDAAGAMGMGSYGHGLALLFYGMVCYGSHVMAMALPLIPTSITTLPHHSAIDAIVEANF